MAPFIFILLLFFPFSIAQQGYDNAQNDPDDCNSTTPITLGYSCNSDPTCQSYLIFPLSVNPSLPPISGDGMVYFSDFPLTLYPINCSCYGQFYQDNISYPIPDTIASDSDYYTIANNTYYGLTTCQALKAQNPSQPLPSIGDKIVIPLRCACPTKNQTTSGAKYLVSYVVTNGDDVGMIADRFKANYTEVLYANGLTADTKIYPFTTLLIPMDHVPTAEELKPVLPPDSAPAVPAAGSKAGSNKKWVGIGIGVGILVIL